MARGRGRGRGRGGGETKSEEPFKKKDQDRERFRPPKAEAYSRDDIDDVLKLNDGEPADEGSDSHMEEDIMVRDDDDGDEDEEDDAGDDDDDDDDSSDEGGGFKAALSKEAKKSGRTQRTADVEGAVEFGTAGWSHGDYYGGEDDGEGSSDEGSDGELNFEEAKRMEDLRAQRLGMAGADPLAVLLGGMDAADPAGAKPDASASAAAEGGAAAGAAAKFESVFAEGAEHESSGPRDFSQLPEARRKKLVKSEAPELAPLLSDFRDKLGSLKELLPLLAPEALSQLPASGAAYLDAKLSLLLSTLANLSYYTLLRAEGAQVRSHPVVSQLVWLKELQEKIAPLDTKLRIATRRAARAAKIGHLRGSAREVGDEDEVEDAPAGPEAKPRLSIRERLRALRRREVGAPDPAENGPLRTARRPEPLAADLLRLPGQRRQKGVSDTGPADLHDVDPTVGAWLPKGTLGEQVMGAQQYARDVAARSKAKSADLDVEPKFRRGRDRRQENQDQDDREVTAAREEVFGVAKLASKEGEEEEENELILAARSKTEAKKERKAQREKEKQEAAVQQQFRPPREMEGRRKTSKKILNNRGLVRVRKKEAANSRVQNRKKYAKKLKGRKGAVQEMRAGADDGATYGGEATGLRTNLRKSQRIS